MSVDRKTFFSMLKNENVPTKKPDIGKANWDTIYKELCEVSVPLTTSQIWDHYVKHAVSRYRTKDKLHEWAETGKCHRLYIRNKYLWYFGEVPKERKRDGQGRFVSS